MRARRQPLNNPNMPRACTGERFRQFLTDAESRSRRGPLSADASGRLTPIPSGKRENFVERSVFSPNKNGGEIPPPSQYHTFIALSHLPNFPTHSLHRTP